MSIGHIFFFCYYITGLIIGNPFIVGSAVKIFLGGMVTGGAIWGTSPIDIIGLVLRSFPKVIVGITGIPIGTGLVTIVRFGVVGLLQV